MTFEEFVTTQQQLAANRRDGDYLPTLWIETRRRLTVHVLMDTPEGAELEVVARHWAEHTAGKHDYFLAFKAGRIHLKVIARIGGVLRETNAPIIAR